MSGDAAIVAFVSFYSLPPVIRMPRTHRIRMQRIFRKDLHTLLYLFGQAAIKPRSQPERDIRATFRKIEFATYIIVS